MISLEQKLFHLICWEKAHITSDYKEKEFQQGFASTTLFFHRLGNNVDFVAKRVLDVGCGYGSTCFHMARHGAQRVVGIDIDEQRIQFAQAKLLSEYNDLSNKVEFRLVTDLKQLDGEKFDVILSKDSFEHIGNPEQCILALQGYMVDTAIFVIGFGPLWKSPYGGHIRFMTALPWAHLLFQESVIMKERRRFRPEENAEQFEQIKGGLNKITLGKLTNILKSSNLEPIYFKTNVHDRKLINLLNILRSVPFCEEYFTFNLYGIWRLKP